jgi:hypothetical protein
MHFGEEEGLFGFLLFLFGWKVRVARLRQKRPPQKAASIQAFVCFARVDDIEKRASEAKARLMASINAEF